MAIQRDDRSRRRYFDDIVGEFVSAISTEFGIEADPHNYAPHEAKKAEKVDELYNLIYVYAQEFVMGELHKALPRGPYRENLDTMSEVMDGIAAQLQFLEEDRIERHKGSMEEDAMFNKIHERVATVLEQAETLLRSPAQVSILGR